MTVCAILCLFSLSMVQWCCLGIFVTGVAWDTLAGEVFSMFIFLFFAESALSLLHQICGETISSDV